VASRIDAPVLGTFDELAGGENKWQVSFSWRYQKSDTHFRGTHEETNREAEHSEVINTVHLAEVGIRYNFDPRTSVSVGVYFRAMRRVLRCCCSSGTRRWLRRLKEWRQSRRRAVQ
jgi:hypothetical protein